MGWEERNGKRYYYRKVRQGERVITIYVGSGQIAEICARDDERNRTNKKNKCQALKKELKELCQPDVEIDSITAQINTLTAAWLYAWGFHKHKGQWRRRRNAKE